MPLRVSLLPQTLEADVVVVIDTLRFTTAACTALANGAASITPCLTIEQARALKRLRPHALLCGERNAVKPDGFAFGNSPLEFTREAVQGRELIWSTTNGTRAVDLAQSGTPLSPPPQPLPPTKTPYPSSSGPDRDLLLCSPVNLRAVVSSLEPKLLAGDVVAIVCAGREGGFALEDAATAGRLVVLLRQRLGDALPVDDGARASACISEAYGEDFARCFGDAQHGRTLGGLGFGSDLQACAAVDAVQVVPRWRDGRFVAG